jgi:Leucine-rich repeat (LRR) protein
MKLKGREKVFWWHFGHITDSKNIPTELPGFTSIDSEDDDEYLAMLLAKVSVIRYIYLKETNVTDEGVKLISSVKQLKHLTLMKHENITKECLSYLNKLTSLEYLDIWKTKIRLEDLSVLTDLKNLRELYISPNDEEDESDKETILEKIIKAEETLPGCAIHTYYQ